MSTKKSTSNSHRSSNITDYRIRPTVRHTSNQRESKSTSRRQSKSKGQSRSKSRSNSRSRSQSSSKGRGQSRSQSRSQSQSRSTNRHSSSVSKPSPTRGWISTLYHKTKSSIENKAEARAILASSPEERNLRLEEARRTSKWDVIQRVDEGMVQVVRLNEEIARWDKAFQVAKNILQISLDDDSRKDIDDGSINHTLYWDAQQSGEWDGVLLADSVEELRRQYDASSSSGAKRQNRPTRRQLLQQLHDVIYADLEDRQFNIRGNKNMWQRFARFTGLQTPIPLKRGLSTFT